MNISPELAENLMLKALTEAKKAALAEEVPVGAVIAKADGQVIAFAHNEVECQKDATQHAEILAIQRAAKFTGDWRLKDCILAVTLEPCSMCLGAIKLARIPVVIFGAYDPEKGACGSLFDLSIDSRLGPVPKVISKIKETECQQILKDFFKAKRTA